MNELFKWLAGNPAATTTLIASFGAAVLSALLIYVGAFLQGREISFWPPRIGARPLLGPGSTTLIDTNEFSRKQEDIHEELDNFFDTTEGFDSRSKTFLLNKIGQNILSLSTIVKEEPGTEVFANLMVYDRQSHKLKMILTCGFYYQKSFHREFPINRTREEGSCGKAFRQKEIIFIDDAFTDDRVFKTLDKKYENMGSLINVPIPDKGVLNIDCPKLHFFEPHDDPKVSNRLEVIQKISDKFLNLYLSVESEIYHK
jgi:hypothetical protein